MVVGDLADSCYFPAIRVMVCFTNWANFNPAGIVEYHNVQAERAAVFFCADQIDIGIYVLFPTGYLGLPLWFDPPLLLNLSLFFRGSDNGQSLHLFWW